VARPADVRRLTPAFISARSLAASAAQAPFRTRTALPVRMISICLYRYGLRWIEAQRGL